MEIEVATFYFAKDCYQPGQQCVPPDAWKACPLATNSNAESLKPAARAYALLFAGSPGWYMITFSALCRRHCYIRDRSSRCEICQKAQQCLPCSTIVEVLEPNVRAEWHIEPELRRFTTSAMFVQNPQYNMIMKRLQTFEYNAQWEELTIWSARMRKVVRNAELRIIIDFEAAIGKLYMGQNENIVKAEKLVINAIMAARRLPSASESRILEGRAYYILSGIRRHQKRREDAEDYVTKAKQLLFGVKPGEDTAAVMYNEASILLETGDEKFQESLALFNLSIDHCRAYDSSINMVPERAHIRLAWLCLSSMEFTAEYGPLLIDDRDFHAKRIEEASNHLSAVNENMLPVRYQMQYLIPLCDLYIVRMQLDEALKVARKAEALIASNSGFRREADSANSRVEYLESLQSKAKPLPKTKAALATKRDQFCVSSARYNENTCFSETTKAVAVIRQPSCQSVRGSDNFDVFLSCHEEQLAWFTANLKNDLHSNRLSICTLHDDFNFHLPFTRRLQKAVEQSRCCVVLLSQQYITTGRTELELQYCMAKYGNCSNRPFVPILLSSCGMDRVPEYIRDTVHVLELNACPNHWKSKLLAELTST